MHYRAFRYRWERMLKAIQLGWVPTAHDLRHYYASVLLSEGTDIVRVSMYLGHSTVTQTLDTYAHVIKRDHTDVRVLLDRAFGELSAL